MAIMYGVKQTYIAEDANSITVVKVILIYENLYMLYLIIHLDQVYLNI